MRQGTVQVKNRLSPVLVGSCERLGAKGVSKVNASVLRFESSVALLVGQVGGRASTVSAAAVVKR